MEQQEKLLKDYTDMEKGAYLGAIASIATADRAATEEELDYLEALADSADLSEEQKEAVLKSATELSEEELARCLDVLKTSQLRFSLIADLMAFAESDKQTTDEEKANIAKIAQHLNINKEQFSLLDQFVQKTSDAEVQPAEMQQQGFLDGLGFGDKFKKAGINSGGFLKGLIGIAGPMILARMVSRGLSGRRSRGGLGGMMGGGLGGMLGGGGLGGMLGGGGMGRMGGGLGSLTSILNGGRGFGSTGGLFGRMFGGRGF
jgi:uncharacterized tellurite resistance protein B-like protein